ncbi:MAG TPA: M12 family metallo-peptidase [Steroidobacteraceae bacterium]|nr:M12 family metallo-peptidase [Steroidobacteraceae bacterium]
MGRIGSRIALCFLALGLAAVASAAQPAIRYAEPVNLALKSAPGSSGSIEFDAYGRRFSLALLGNERVLQKLSTDQRNSLSSYRLLRGSIAGVQGSWVRLTETPRGVEGAIWDGSDFYAITRYENIAPLLTTPLSASPDQTVVYRLSDARDALPADFCAASAASDLSKAQGGTVLDQYETMIAELQTGGVVTPSITRQLEISLIADTAFQRDAEGGDPTAAMLARLNIVEGIFSEQVGLLIVAGEVRLMSPEADPFTSTKPATLLDQLGSYRLATPSVRARGIAHLMTGKDLDGTTAGIAYVRTVCEKERAVSLSQRNYGTTISALVMAHEIGHNLGASHDGEAGTPCASTGAGFIMASSVTGFGTFSQCSIDTMKPVIASASCITAPEFADITVDSEVNLVAGEGGVPFTLPFVVRSMGNVDAQSAQFTLTVPPSLSYQLDAATSTQGSCSVASFTINCDLGDVAPGARVDVGVTGHGRVAGSIAAQGRVAAGNDRITSNNNRQIVVNLRSGIDARLAMSASGAEFAVGAPIEIYADVSSLRAMAVSNSTLSVSLNQPVSSASVSGGNCIVNATSVNCAIGEIPSGTTRRLTVQATAQTAGPLFANASISVPGDGDLANNGASAGGWVQAARDLEVSAPSLSLDLPVGSVHEISFTVRSRGPVQTSNAELLLTLPGAMAVDGIEAGTVCSHPSDYVWRCALGALAPGEFRVVKLRIHAVAPTTGDIAAVAVTADDGYAGNNSVDVRLRIDHVIDLAVAMASGGSGVEGVPFDGQVTLASNGRLNATDATLDVALHAAGRLRSVKVHNGEGCALLDDTHARCALPPLMRGTNLYVDYQTVFDEPGDYDITFAVNAPGDSAPVNDMLTRPVLVRPFLDASVSGALTLDGLFGAQTRVQTFTVTAGRRGLVSARFLAAHAMPALRVEAISADIGDCRVDADLGGICDFTGLAADARATVSVTYQAMDGSWVVDPVVSITTPGDVAPANNALTARVETLGKTDIELRVTGNVGGPRSTSLTFPVIELVNGESRAKTPRLEVTLPEGVTVADVSASEGICTGTTTLRCDFASLEPFAHASVSLLVRASSNGSFTSNVKVTALNDTNAANDSRDVALEINGATVSASDGPGKGSGGGGSLEWMGLAMLTMLVLRKWGQPPFSSKRGQASLH